MALQIVRAESVEQLAGIKKLWHEYMNWDAEVSANYGVNVSQLIRLVYEDGQFELPGQYVSPEGCLLLALYDSQAAGCGAWRKMDHTTCEIKRMYVRPAFRGKRIGKSLLEQLIQDAQQHGFKRLLLETAAFMNEAQGLYASLGFQSIECYYDEVPAAQKAITLYMELKLG